MLKRIGLGLFLTLLTQMNASAGELHNAETLPSLGRLSSDSETESPLFDLVSYEPKEWIDESTLASIPEPCIDQSCCAKRWYEELTILMAIDGSKQPQDLGVNANFGGQFAANLGLPLIDQWGIGMQFGTSIVAAENAVQVYELLGESTNRLQSYTSIGLFQRTDSGFAWGITRDYLHQDSFDTFSFGQWRMTAQWNLGRNNQMGLTGMVSDESDQGLFDPATTIRLAPITQGHLFLRHFWQTGAQTTAWFGIAERHSEDNIVTGLGQPKESPFLFGADVLMPLNCNWAIYGETNIMTPVDTGCVDAFLGIQWSPGRHARNARRGQYSPIHSLAAPTNFSIDGHRL